MAKKKLPSAPEKNDDLLPLDALTGQRDLTQLEQSFLLSRDAPTGDEIAFVHAVFSHVGLPRKRVQGDVFKRTSGDAWLIVQPGYANTGNGPELQTIPYGALPRLALAHVTSYALRNNTREIPIGRSASEFLRQLGMDSDGRRFTTLRTQMHALAACRLQLGYKGRQFNGQAVSQFDTWMKNSSERQPALWPGVLLLTADYYESLKTLGVPVDMRAYMNLKGSAMAMDIYTWLAHRLYRVEGRPVMLPWPAVKAQFGQEYADSKDFKKEFRKALADVLMQYPKARVQPVAGGLLLAKSPPPVAPRIFAPGA